MHAIRTIEYAGLSDYFYVFSVGKGDIWLCWEEVAKIAERFDFPTVPAVEANIRPGERGRERFEQFITKCPQHPSLVEGERGGFVVRVERGFRNEEFESCILKWARKDHVKKDLPRNWRKAKLKS